MKKYLAFLGLLLLPAFALADPWDAAVSQNAGNYVESYPVTVSSTTATQLIDPTIAIKSANIHIVNNSAFALWIGTNTSTLLTTGYPVFSSSTYSLGGTYTGSLFAIAGTSTVASTNARVLYYLKNDALR